MTLAMRLGDLTKNSVEDAICIGWHDEEVAKMIYVEDVCHNQLELPSEKEPRSHRSHKRKSICIYSLVQILERH